MRYIGILLLCAAALADVGATGSDRTICLFLQHERNGSIVMLDPSSGMIRWRHDRPERPVLYAQSVVATCDVRPRVTKDRVYVADSGSGTLVALERRSGKLLWEKKLPYTSKNLFVECDGEDVIVSAYDGQPVKTFDKAGNEMWEAALAGQPVVRKNRVYVARVHGPNRLYALDRKTGAQDWEHHHGGWPVHWDGETFYFASTGGLMAFSVDEQKELWRVPGFSYFAGLFDGKVYLHRNGTEIVAVDAKEGKEVATMPFAGGRLYTQILVEGRLVVTMDSQTGNVHVLDFEDKKELAEYETGVRTVDLRSVAAIVGRIAVVANPKARRVESTGWQCDVPEGPAGLAAAGRRVVVASGKRLLGLDAATGRIVWRRELPQAITQLAAGVSRP